MLSGNFFKIELKLAPFYADSYWGISPGGDNGR